MKTRKCSRLWLAEAVRDGRVIGAEAVAFERHAMACNDCGDEAKELAELGRRLQSLPTRRPDTLSLRRQRRRLLEEYDAETFRIPHRRWSSTALGVAACLGLVALVGMVWWSRRGHPLFATNPIVAGATIEVRPQQGARWSETKGQDIDRVDLLDGAIWLRIERASMRTRVLIALPDGTIEDFGTTLTVHVTGGRTTEVAVEQGEVAVYLKDRPEMRLKGGQSWIAPAQTAATAPDPSDVEKIAPRRVASHSETAAPPSGSRAPTTRSIEKHSSAAPRAEGPDEIAAGNAEDLAYMRMIDLLRAGKKSEAQQAARDYLSRFPDGFRRVEVREVAGTGNANGASTDNSRTTP
jgi:hypothetical protein